MMKKLKYPNAQVGQCPNCGEFAIDSETTPEYDSEGHIVYNYTCSACNFDGQEVYDVIFIEHRPMGEE